MSDFNSDIVDEFRANSGKVGGMFEGAPLLLLHTTGARSGAARVTPLMYLPLDGRTFVFASAAGATSHPDWYYNATAQPEVEIEIGEDRITKTAVELEPEERASVYAEQVSRYPQFGGYEKTTAGRAIPVLELT